MDRRVAGQGEKCVVAIDRASGSAFVGEVIATDESKCYTLGIDGTETWFLKEALKGGYRPVGTEPEQARIVAVPATKVIKGDGTWMYFAPGPVTKINPTGTQWYTRGGVFV